MRKILGVDPGKSGGLSIIDEQLNLIATYPMPTVKIDGKDKVCPKGIQEILSKYDIELAVVELVGARPGQGVVSMFSFGDSYGVARALAELHAARVIYARPQEWRGFQSLTGLSKEQVAEVSSGMTFRLRTTRTGWQLSTSQLDLMSKLFNAKSPDLRGCFITLRDRLKRRNLLALVYAGSF